MATMSAELAALLQEVSDLKALYASAAHNRTLPKRNKYATAITNLANSVLPFIVLDNSVYTNKSEQSMNQQFKRIAAEHNVPAPSCVFVGDKKLLVDFDRENAEEAFEQYILERAGISKKELLEITADLDKATR